MRAWRDRIRGVALALIVGLFAHAGSAAAYSADWYYVLVFGSQSDPKRLKYTHTWATFVRATGEGQDPSAYALQSHTISWYPASREVKVFSPFPEQGVNLTLEETLAEVGRTKEKVKLWGPFLLKKEVYDRSLEIYRLAQTDLPRYRAISNSLDMLVSDCIHAVAACDPTFGRNHYPLIRIGHPASRFIAREIMVRSLEERGLDQSLHDHSWLIPRLGLCHRGIEVIAPRVIPHRRCFLCTVGP